MSGLHSLRDGLRALLRSFGLVPLVLATNLGLALVLAVPFALQVETDVAHTGASSALLYGFDYDWWSRWEGQARGFAADFAPDLLGVGFAFRNLELLLRGRVPGGLFADGGDAGPDAAILGLGVLYLLLQIFLGGGLLSTYRGGGGWTFRGLVHGSGFYFGRLLRVSLLALAATGLLFALHAPFASWVDHLARESVSERTALVLTFGRRGLLLLAILAVHAVSSYAKVIVVADERPSALLAVASSAGFCLRRFFPILGQYLAAGLAGLLLLGLFALADGRLAVLGFRSQLVAFALIEAFVGLRIALRLWLLASQLALRREIVVTG